MTLRGKKQEDLYFHQRDTELLQMQKDALQKARDKEVKQAHRQHCAQCGGDTVARQVRGVPLQACHDCGSVTVAKKDLVRVLKGEFAAHFYQTDDEFRAA